MANEPISTLFGWEMLTQSNILRIINEQRVRLHVVNYSAARFVFKHTHSHAHTVGRKRVV